MSGPRIAIVGAGVELAGDLVVLLLERGIAAERVRILDREATAGETIEAGGIHRRIEWAAPEALSGADVALFCGPGALAAELVPVVRARGGVAIDSTPFSRADASVPLVVPEVNGAMLSTVPRGSVVASPAPGSVALALVLSPLQRLAGLRRVVVTSMEPASRRGPDGIETLSRQAVHMMQGRGFERDDEEDDQIAFNLRVQAPAEEGGWSEEESAVASEVPRILGAPELSLAATGVRVPVFFGSSQAVHLELAREVPLGDVEMAIREAPGLLLAGSVEDRLASSLERQRLEREKEEAMPEGDGERNDREEIAEDGLEEMDDEDSGADDDDREPDAEREEYEDDKPRRRRRPAPRTSSADVAIDLFPGPVEAAGSEFVHVVRLRFDPTLPTGLAFWLSFDELRRGVAMNLLGLAELAIGRPG